MLTASLRILILSGLRIGPLKRPRSLWKPRCWYWMNWGAESLDMGAGHRFLCSQLPVQREQSDDSHDQLSRRTRRTQRYESGNFRYTVGAYRHSNAVQAIRNV